MPDVKGVLKLYSKLFAPSENIRAVEDILNDKNYRFYVMSEKGETISTMTAVICRNAVGKGQPYMLIDNIATDPKHQGKGLASKLYKEVEAWAKERGCSKIIIVSNKRFKIEKFYHSLGLESKTSKVYIKRLWKMK